MMLFLRLNLSNEINTESKTVRFELSNHILIQLNKIDLKKNYPNKEKEI